MPFHVCYYHVVWATRNREPFITADLERIGLRAIQNKSDQLHSPIHALNAVEDHVHVAVSIALSVSIANWVKQVKGVSAFEVNTTYPDLPSRFGWQKGYGILRFGAKQLPFVKQYIGRQKEHHRSQMIEPYLERIEDQE